MYQREELSLELVLCQLYAKEVVLIIHSEGSTVREKGGHH